MANILYVHGYGSDKNSTTGQRILIEKLYQKFACIDFSMYICVSKER